MQTAHSCREISHMRDRNLVVIDAESGDLFVFPQRDTLSTAPASDVTRRPTCRRSARAFGFPAHSSYEGKQLQATDNKLLLNAYLEVE